jgi:hypothetical protein
MDNTESLAALGTQDTGRRQTVQKNMSQKTKKMSNMNPTKTLIEPKLYMNPNKNLIEPKPYMNPTKNLIELKLYMNPT